MNLTVRLRAVNAFDATAPLLESNQDRFADEDLRSGHHLSSACGKMGEILLHAALADQDADAVGDGAFDCADHRHLEARGPPGADFLHEARLFNRKEILRIVGILVARQHGTIYGVFGNAVNF